MRHICPEWIFPPQHLKSGQYKCPEPLPILPPHQTSKTKNKITFQDKIVVCPLRQLSTGSWCHHVPRWVPSNAAGLRVEQKEPHQPWEGKKLPAQERDRHQLGKHEEAGLSADSPPASVITGDHDVVMNSQRTTVKSSLKSRLSWWRCWAARTTDAKHCL